ncbi:hypothetical protein EFR94_09700 [Levilactobacillus brevis]|uniref:hypothetical protein n=1 Tax=Levilactobacillus brevis TaxID=1580 RepID=UPI0021A5E9EA|nr:hypothetical protein [Levilactobacillus brevis]MCT3567657.1 hypothetical protein [Levilactobacillus brevis]
MIEEKYYTCNKSFDVMSCDDDGFRLDDDSTREIPKGSKWYWTPSNPDMMWRNDPNLCGWISGIEPDGRDSEYFELTGVRRDNDK